LTDLDTIAAFYYELFANYDLELVGDYNEHVVAHIAIPRTLALASTALKIKVECRWIKSSNICDDTGILAKYAALWLVPRNPYLHMNGALKAIQFARETGRPLNLIHTHFS
jgi:CTP synthase (UTP-ammonia lyase)